MGRILKFIFAWALVAAFINNAFFTTNPVVAEEVIGVTTSDEIRARFAAGTGGDVRLDADITLICHKVKYY